MFEIDQPPIRILVVDDEPDLEPLFIQRFRKPIRKGEMELFFAPNGVEALRLLEEEEALDLVITDINMPEMDGLTLLAEMKQRDPLLKGVVISAYGDMQNIRNAMNRGAFDFVTKPIDFDDLSITIEKTYREASTLRRAMEAHNQLLAMEQELDIARHIQQTILAQHTEDLSDIAAVNIAGTMLTAKAVGGDFFLTHRKDQNTLVFGIGDVAGKGVPAALFMAMSCSLMYSLLLPEIPLEENLARINKTLCRGNDAGLFLTLFVGVLDFTTGRLAYCNAGHNPPCHLGAEGELRFLPSTGGLVLGVFEDAAYESRQLDLTPGDHLFLYTDGITEAMDADQGLYTETRLGSCLKQNHGSAPGSLLQAVLGDVRSFTQGVEQHDDITALDVQWEPDKA